MSSKTILLIEDNPDERELMRLAFAQSDIPHNFVAISDGIEALDYLWGTGEFSDRDTSLPALVIIDLNLPRMSGIEVLRRIRGHPRTRLIPAIVISSSDEPQEIIDSYFNGCNSYIRKPVDFTQLQYFAREISRYWLVVNQLPPVFGVSHE